MSGETDGYNAVDSETRRRARKSHECDACGETIERGHTYVYASWIYDGRPGSVKRCLRCQAIYDHLVDKCHASTDELAPMPDLGCGLKYEDEWGKLPDEIAALAFALPGEEVAGT